MTMSAKVLGSSWLSRLRPCVAGQVIEPVAVLQLLHLVFEDEVEGRAQHAAELGLLLGQAADPEVDVVEAAAAVGR